MRLLKGLFFAIDRKILGGRLKARKDQNYLAAFGAQHDAQIIINHNKSRSYPLDYLCDFHGSDKGELSPNDNPYPWDSHSYSDYYSLLFEPARLHVRLVFECGIGTNNTAVQSNMGVDGRPGASLRVWRDYFPNAHVIGADIDASVLFEEDRIQTYLVDQCIEESVSKMWSDIDLTGFELMIDDGLHNFEAGKSLFSGSIDRLAEGGVYIIEDVSQADMLSFKEFFDGLEYKVDYVSLRRPPRKGRYSPLGENQLIAIRHASSV